MQGGRQAQQRLRKTAREEESLKILIRLENFLVSGTARTYHYEVTSEDGASRRFRVDVPLESFRLTPLKYQDGPLISRERLEQALDIETEQSHADAHLAVAVADINAYMTRHYPPKARGWTRIMPKPVRKERAAQR
jgi:hypothetical protein